jgi:tRNA modification GTPase
VDGSQPLQTEDADILLQIRGRKSVVAVNKNDLPPAFPLEELRGKIFDVPLISISAISSSGIENLKEAIRRVALGGKNESPSEVFLSNMRHKQAIEKSRQALNQALAGLSANLAPEFLVVDLQEAQAALGEIVGSHTADDILERIFNQFCIGK